MNDVTSHDDIIAVVDAFYGGIEEDELLGAYFAPLDMRSHLPRMYAFWSSVVFQTGTYRGRPFDVHTSLADLEPRHFERWVERFTRTVDDRFAGVNAQKMKARAAQIAWVFSSRLCATPIDARVVDAASR